MIHLYTYTNASKSEKLPLYKDEEKTIPLLVPLVSDSYYLFPKFYWKKETIRPFIVMKMMIKDKLTTVFQGYLEKDIKIN